MDDIWSGEPSLVGAVLEGKYRIDARLGQGGMGAVYRATHLGTTRTVAVKVIHPRFSQDPEFVERFRREAEAAGRLRHPNVVDVTDFGFAPTRTGQVAYLREAGFTFGVSAGSMLFQLLDIVVTPLTAIMTAQPYLKARHAGGEATDTP